MGTLSRFEKQGEKEGGAEGSAFGLGKGKAILFSPRI